MKKTLFVSICVLLLLLTAGGGFISRAVKLSRSTNAMVLLDNGNHGCIREVFESPHWKFSNRLLKLLNLEPIIGYQRIDLDSAPVASVLAAVTWDGCEILAMNLSDTDISDADIRRLAGIESLQKLWLTNTRLTSRSLKYLHPHNDSLQRLVLSKTSVGPEMDAIRPFHQITWLWLDQSLVDDSSMAAIGSLHRLENLNISHANISSRGITQLTDCPLKYLWADHTRVADEAAVDLAKHPTLEVLSLSSTPFGDPGLAELAKLPRLRILHLSGTRVSKASISILKSMPMLEKLTMPGESLDRDSLLELLQSKTLKQLGLADCLISEEEIAHIASGFHVEVWTFSTQPRDEK